MMANNFQSKRVVNVCGCDVLNHCNVNLMFCSVRVWGMGRDTSGGIANYYALDRAGIESLWGEIFPTRPDRLWSHPASYIMGTMCFSG
jgi:hypothetical protein